MYLFFLIFREKSGFVFRFQVEDIKNIQRMELLVLSMHPSMEDARHKEAWDEDPSS